MGFFVSCMIGRFGNEKPYCTTSFYFIASKIIKEEDVVEKSELLAIILVLGIIGLSMYMVA